MPTMSPQQEAFIEAVASGNDNITLDSCAGSGKTTTLVAAAEALVLRGQPGSTLTALAFNKRNAVELGEKFPEGTNCRTFHSFGNDAWKRRLGRWSKINQNKTWDLLDQLKMKFRHPGLPKLVSAAKANGMEPRSTFFRADALLEDTPQAWEDLIDQFDCAAGEEGQEDLIECARKVLEASVAQAFQGVVDFDDQLYMPTLFGGIQPQGIIFLDECQDLSPLQHRMVQLMRPSRVICAGDPRQSIYAFRGADSRSMASLTEMFGCRRMALTYSFRCPRAVVAEAQQWVNHIQPTPEAPEGANVSWGPWDQRDLLPGDMILCRNTKPLISVAMALIRRGVGMEILGKDIGEGLITLAKRYAKGGRNLGQTLERLEIYGSEEAAKKRGQNKFEQAKALEEKIETLEVIAEGLDLRGSPEQLYTAISRLFSNPAATIKGSTVHKAKGLEWQRTIWLDPGLIPSPWASTPEAKTQEENLAYVCITRAKETLVHADLANWIEIEKPKAEPSSSNPLDLEI